MTEHHQTQAFQAPHADDTAQQPAAHVDRGPGASGSVSSGFPEAKTEAELLVKHGEKTRLSSERHEIHRHVHKFNDFAVFVRAAKFRHITHQCLDDFIGMPAAAAQSRLKRIDSPWAVNLMCSCRQPWLKIVMGSHRPCPRMWSATAFPGIWAQLFKKSFWVKG